MPAPKRARAKSPAKRLTVSQIAPANAVPVRASTIARNPLASSMHAVSPCAPKVVCRDVKRGNHPTTIRRLVAFLRLGDGTATLVRGTDSTGIGALSARGEARGTVAPRNATGPRVYESIHGRYVWEIRHRVQVSSMQAHAPVRIGEDRVRYRVGACTYDLLPDALAPA